MGEYKPGFPLTAPQEMVELLQRALPTTHRVGYRTGNHRVIHPVTLTVHEVVQGC